MHLAGRFIVLLASAVLFFQCAKNKGTNETKALPFGRYVELQPVDLPRPPDGLVYQAWTFRLEKSGDKYFANFFPYQKFGWNPDVYKFTDPVTDADVGRTFKASPDTQNLFTLNPTAFMRSDSLSAVVEKLLRGEKVSLSGAARNLEKMVGFLLSLEPAGETGPDTARPASPFLAGASNDSGIVTLVYPVNYRLPGLNPSYFLSTPSDGLTALCPCEYTDSSIIRNEAKGVWLGYFDTTRVEFGLEAARPDTLLCRLARELLPGWQFEAWIEKYGQRVSLGHFRRADSADLNNPYAQNPDSLFPFPGEDFIKNPPPGISDNTSGVLGDRLLVSLETDPNADTSLFPLILFLDTIPRTFSSQRTMGEDAHRNLQFNFLMQNRARFFPKMLLRILPETKP